MFRHTSYVVIVLSFVCACVALAEDKDQPMAADPATAPTTQVAQVAENQSTPRGALKVMTRAMEAGDSDAIRSVLHTVTPAEKKLTDSLVALAQATAKMRKAAVGAYGAANAKGLTGDPAAVADTMMRIDHTAEKIEGDTATISDPDHPTAGESGVKLVRVDGQWKLPVGDMFKGGEIEQVIDGMVLQTKVLNEAADEATAGKYKTAEEAGQALRNKMMKAMMERQKAATMPSTTTAPATMP